MYSAEPKGRCCLKVVKSGRSAMTDRGRLFQTVAAARTKSPIKLWLHVQFFHALLLNCLQFIAHVTIALVKERRARSLRGEGWCSETATIELGDVDTFKRLYEFGQVVWFLNCQDYVCDRCRWH